MYLDLTHEFGQQMPVFPGDAGISLIQTSDVFKDGISDYEVKTGMHVGTHIDAPAHMLPGGRKINEYPVSRFFGRGVLINAKGKSAAGDELLEGVEIKKGDIVLVMFGWSSEFGRDEYYHNYPEILESLAKKLGSLGVSMLGMDSPSPDRAPYKVHKTLFNSDVLIIENLINLERLEAYKNFEIVALPVKFQTDSAAARVVAKIND